MVNIKKIWLKISSDVIVVTNKDIFYRSTNTEILRGGENLKNISIDDALDLSPTFIAIKEKNVATQVIKWITFGNFLHKSAVISSLMTFLLPRLTPMAPENFKRMIIIIFGCSSIIATLIYNSCWMFDPCSKYQVLKE